jgi:hypothetical protein
MVLYSLVLVCFWTSCGLNIVLKRLVKSVISALGWVALNVESGRFTRPFHLPSSPLNVCWNVEDFQHPTRLIAGSWSCSLYSSHENLSTRRPVTVWKFKFLVILFSHMYDCLSRLIALLCYRVTSYEFQLARRYLVLILCWSFYHVSA